jgi:hypothetical protein
MLMRERSVAISMRSDVLRSVSSTGIEHVVNRVVLGLREASVVGAKPRTY